MGKCEYLNCMNLTRRIKRDKGSNLSFFRFPKEIELCKKWIEACQRDNLFDVGVDRLHKSHVICGVHFKDFDFVNPLTKKKLRIGAVPSQHSVSTVPKSNFISSFGHYVVRNRHEKYIKSKSNSDKELILKKKNSKSKIDMETRKDLASLQKLTSIAQNIGNLLPPISPPSVHSVNDCNLPSGDSENCSFVHQNMNRISEQFFQTHRLPNEKLLPNNFKIDDEESIYEEEKMEIESLGEETSFSLSDQECNVLGNPGEFTPEDVTTLILDNKKLKDFENVRYEKVVNLSANNNEISELYCFVPLLNLKNLNLSGNSLHHVEDLNLLGHVTNIDLSNNRIQSLSAFVPLPRKSYTNLLTLNLSGNKIAEIVDFSVLSNLNELNLSNNYFKCLKNFGSFLPNSIVKIALEDNYIRDLFDFNELTSLQNLKNISINNNPCFNVHVAILDDEKSITLLQQVDFIPFMILMFPQVTVIDRKSITSEQREIAKKLITDDILKPEFKDKNLLLSSLAKYCLKSDSELIKEEILAEPEDSPLVQPTAGSSEISHERDNHACFSASCSRNKYAIEEKSRQNYVELIEERARNYKLTRKIETLTDRIQYLETILSRNKVSTNDIIIKSEVDETEVS